MNTEIFETEAAKPQAPEPDKTDYSLETLLAKVKEHSPLSDIEKIEKAYYYAEAAHQGQKRRHDAQPRRL